MTVEPGWAEHIARHATAGPDGGTYIGPTKKLVTAGQQLLFERGDTSYTIGELVRRAGVGLKTFYACFPNKETFLATVFTQSVAGATPEIRERILAYSDDPLLRLWRAVTWPLEWREENAALHRVIANEHMRIAITSPETIAETSRSYEALIRELVVDATAAGLVRPADLDWDVHIVTSLVTTSFHTLILGLGEPDRAVLAENVWRFCLSALGGTARGTTPPGPADGPGVRAPGV
ncbi:TetR/AcrR family transcriptional regulator [Streptomyces sp. NPDC058001]|uniref:TetR/AcrR family transcriptional regulator n=1 Tax=Streptomyces sp. NPDC058001 TaxID=3346300 RepID=UPI0036E1CBE5